MSEIVVAISTFFGNIFLTSVVSGVSEDQFTCMVIQKQTIFLKFQQISTVGNYEKMRLISK